MKLEQKTTPRKIQDIEPGSLVLIKDPNIVFSQIEFGEDNKRSITSQRLDKAMFYIELPMLVSVTPKEIPNQWQGNVLEKGSEIQILVNGKVYSSLIRLESEVFQKLDFMKIPESGGDDVDDWITKHFGARGRVFYVTRDFRAHQGNSRQLYKNTRKLKRNDSFETCYVRRDTKIVGVEARRHAGRQVIIFDFFADGALCWMCFKLNGGLKTKSRPKFFEEYFQSIGDRTPHEKERIQEKIRIRKQEDEKYGIDEDYDQ